ALTPAPSTHRFRPLSSIDVTYEQPPGPGEAGGQRPTARLRPRAPLVFGRPHPEEPPKAASRRMEQQQGRSVLETRAPHAPRDEVVRVKAMFDTLAEKLPGILDRLTRRGALTEADVDAALREVRRALIEADVALDVARSFVDKVRTRAIGVEVVKSVTPG